MKSLAIVTSTRADYGLLYPIIQKFREYEGVDFKLSLIVTGTHLEPQYGNTIDEIINDKVRIDYQIPCSVNSDTEKSIAENISETIKKFTDYFVNSNLDAVMVLGDRYEILGVSLAAMICRLPIFHISGGDTTEGAIDECIRHSITKMSYLHFTTNSKSRYRVIQLGESPKRVFNVGSTSIDNILNENLLDKKEVLTSIGLAACDYILCTYHPVTLNHSSALEDIQILISIFKDCPIEVIITKSNSDLGGNEINNYLDSVERIYPNIHVYSSLGRIRYLSLMKFAECIIGNSSSGIVEAPSFHIPIINIGERQKGRLMSKSIITINLDAQEIKESLSYVLSGKAQQQAQHMQNPYGDGNSAENIVKITLEHLENKINLKKTFFDIDTKEKL